MNQPTITVNKLAEYLVSKGAKQRQLLHQRKHPDPNFNVGMYYAEAEEAIQHYLASDGIDTQILSNQHSILSQKTPDKIGKIRRVAANISAIERFQEMLDDIDFKGGEPEIGLSRPNKLKIMNVEISVRPEIVVRGQDKKGRPLVGAVKLHMSTSDRFAEESAGYVSAIVQQYCKQELVQNDEIVYADYCQVIDVGNGLVFGGVKSTIQRIKDIEAECQNIFALWPSI